MQSDYNKRDFEEFVRQNADQYRMFPSDKVWQGIENTLHTRRKWYGLGLALLLFLTGAGVSWVMLSTPNRTRTLASTTLVEQSIAGTDAGSPVSREALSTTKPDTHNSPYIFSEPGLSRTKGSHSSFQEALINNQQVQPAAPDGSSALAGRMLEEASAMAVTLGDADGITGSREPVSRTVENGVQRMTVSVSAPVTASKNTNTMVATVQPRKAPVVAEVNTPLVDDSPVLPPPTPESAKETPSAINLAGSNLPDLSIESVVNVYQRGNGRKRVKLEVYVAPMVTYRKLSENKAFLQSAASMGTVPNYAAYSDVKNYVTHKPDMGLELGITARYALSGRLAIKGGLQFNVSRYDIRAFSATRERAIVVLDDQPGTSYQAETVYWTHNNGRPSNWLNAGSTGNWLQNLYYSVSVPVGAEYMLTKKRKANIGIAASIQPTYVIRDRAYLISTDYKNYVGAPGDMLRRYNMNTGFEAFFSYNTRKSVIHIGPEVRYQLHSTFKDKYPVKENLFGFGLKVGVQLRK